MNVYKKYPFIDVTAEICPFTFVRTKILLDKVESGSVICVRLSGDESLGNVPSSVRAEGHDIISCDPENKHEIFGPHILKIRKR